MTVLTIYISKTCSLCRKYMKILEEPKVQHPNHINFHFIDADKYPGLMMIDNITSIPTTFVDGYHTIEGVQSVAQLEKFLSSMGAL